jgi:hypothetical protein
MSRTREYQSYQAAKNRCTNPHHPSFANYGGRGIEFRYTSVEAFFADLGSRPEGRTLDRIDVNGHYEIGNLHWATPKEQANNRRKPVRRRRADLAAIHQFAKSLAAAGSRAGAPR